jgi:FtsP/CotA-like multicopper oxidase with cupredoxin domain
VTDAVQRRSAALADRRVIERELGAGGMATVYLAHDVRHDRKMALKVLRIRSAGAVPLALFLLLTGEARPSISPSAIQDEPSVLANDNRHAAGRLVGGTLTVRLEAREGVWHPEGMEAPPGFTIEAFAEEGGPLLSPGPLLRVPLGTVVRASMRNRLGRPLLVRGLIDRTDNDTAGVELQPGEVREFRFVARRAGTYYYWGRTRDNRAGIGIFEDGQLLGALVVDAAPMPPNERLLVIQLWADRTDTVTFRHTFLVNGLSWPHTERMQATVGDSLHWRVINASVAPHPMHLHGFYYRVDAHGDGVVDTLYRPDQSRMAVTQFLLPGSTVALTWSPKRPGHWLYHCHFIAHIAHAQHLGEAHPEYQHNHALGGMAGLIVGIEVRPRPGDAAEVPPPPARRLRLFADERAGYFGGRPGYGFVLQEGDEPAPDSIRIPGTPILLQREEPVAITVVNRTHVGMSVHWHGIELTSEYDGVPGWSGDASRVAPLIAPGDSFTVRLTPDRAGTFIYHTHADEAEQLASGLYGPLVVLAPGERWDGERDRIFLMGWGGPGAAAPPFMNGSASPPPVRLRAGQSYRLRFINITPSNNQRIRLLADSTTATTWRLFAKDGAQVTPAQAVETSADLILGAGETYDYTLERSQPVRYTLEIATFIRGRAPVLMRVPVIVE